MLNGDSCCQWASYILWSRSKTNPQSFVLRIGLPALNIICILAVAVFGRCIMHWVSAKGTGVTYPDTPSLQQNQEMWAVLHQQDRRDCDRSPFGNGLGRCLGFCIEHRYNSPPEQTLASNYCFLRISMRWYGITDVHSTAREDGFISVDGQLVFPVPSINEDIDIWRVLFLLPSALVSLNLKIGCWLGCIHLLLIYLPIIP